MNYSPQILTQEDWNIVLFAGMERTTHWAALYFVLLMTFGNYVLFNLLVAILVEGFSKQDELFDNIRKIEVSDKEFARLLTKMDPEAAAAAERRRRSRELIRIGDISIMKPDFDFDFKFR